MMEYPDGMGMTLYAWVGAYYANPQYVWNEGGTQVDTNLYYMGMSPSGASYYAHKINTAMTCPASTYGALTTTYATMHPYQALCEDFP